MKTNIILDFIKICVVILVVLSNFTKASVSKDNVVGEINSVESDRIPEILTMISDSIHSNYDQIKTWQGKLEVITDYIYEGARAEKVFKEDTDGKGDTPNIIREHRESTIEFSANTEKESLYANYYPAGPLEYSDPESGRNLGSRGIAARRKAVVTPEYQIDCMGDTMRNGVIMSRKAVKQARQKSRPMCMSNMHPVYDPRELFAVFGNHIWEVFHRMAQHINEHRNFTVDGYELKVEERKNGSVVEYHIQQPVKIAPDQYLFVSMTFSSSKDFNIILYQETDHNGRLLQKRTWNYDLVDGVYLPSAITKQDFELDTGDLRSEEIITLKDSKINRPIPSETFTYKNLGLENGDKFTDRIENKEYTYRDEMLIEVEKTDE